jgi:hypothetical protein
MASEAPGDQGKLSRPVPVLGPLLGFLVGFHVVWVTLTAVLEPELVRQIPFLWQIPLVIGGLAGAGISGILQLATQGRAAEIPCLLRLLLRAALWLTFFFVSLFLGAWLGERLFGHVGYWIGSVASFVLIALVRAGFERRSSRQLREEKR